MAKAKINRESKRVRERRARVAVPGIVSQLDDATAISGLK